MPKICISVSIFLQRYVYKLIYREVIINNQKSTLRKDINSTAQVDVSIIQHLLAFWESRGINTTPVWQLLKLNQTQTLPRWVAAARLSDVYLYMVQQGFDYRLLVSTGKYLAAQDLSLIRLLHYGDSFENVLPQYCRFSHSVVGRIAFDIESDAGEKRIVLKPLASDNTLNYAAVLVASTLYFVCQTMLEGTEFSNDLTVYLPSDCYQKIGFSGLSDSSGQPDSLALANISVMEADVFALGFSRVLWQRNNPFQQPELYRNELRNLEKGNHKFREYLDVYGELKGMLQACLLERQVSQEYMAERLGISVRNLQRRLKGLGTNYQNLLDEARHTLSLQLLKSEELPLYEVAYMVGYTEPSAFYKAFKRWTGMTPGDYRLANDQPLMQLQSGSDDLVDMADQ